MSELEPVDHDPFSPEPFYDPLSGADVNSPQAQRFGWTAMNYPQHVAEGLATLPERAIGAAGQLQRTGEYDPGPIVEAAMLPMSGTFAGAPAGALGAGPVRGIRAYHGSPYDFDRFDMSKIGTGEGAQAYGHGLYFAEREGVARQYRDTLSNRVTPGAYRIGDELVEPGSPRAEAARLMQAWGQDAKTTKALIDLKKPGLQNKEAIQSALDDFAKLPLSEIKPAGRIYEVNINAHPDQFLDWDKPLTQQSVGHQFWPAPVENRLPATGKQLYDYLGRNKAEDTFRRAGIPGIKYLDQGSRGAGEGTRNYVLFRDDIIDILRKYGIAGLAALPPSAKASLQLMPVDHDPFAPSPDQINLPGASHAQAEH